MTATLGSVERHSMGDLTLTKLNFTVIAASDTYGITNFPGALGCWISPWAIAVTAYLSVNYTNSGTGVTLSFVGENSATSASVYLLSGG
jgi:hypothetical protein